MTGRRPKPTALKLLAGNPGKRKLNKDEPKFKGLPQCPEWLNDAAKTEWERITFHLIGLDMLRAVDTASLASYCQSFARWVQAERVVEVEGQTVREPVMDKQGAVVGYKTKRHPATTIAKDAQAAMLRSAALFGFDPSSRSRISLGEPAPTDAFEEFLKTS